MSDYLSPADLGDLTDARTRPAQIRWLEAHGWVYTIGSKGNVKVLRGYRDAKLGIIAPKAARTSPEPLALVGAMFIVIQLVALLRA